MIIKQKEEDYVKEEVKDLSKAVKTLVPNIFIEDTSVKKV